MPFANAIEFSSAHLMVIVAPDREIKRRALDALRQSGIQSSMHYPCIADFSGFEGHLEAKLELTREFTGRAITLPLYPDLNPDLISDIVGILHCA